MCIFYYYGGLKSSEVEGNLRENFFDVSVGVHLANLSLGLEVLDDRSG